VKYTGYGIQKGKLSVRVAYHIENRKLTAENNIYLDQLTFGDRTESATATTLPVLFAVALMRTERRNSTSTCRYRARSTTRSSASAASS